MYPIIEIHRFFPQRGVGLPFCVRRPGPFFYGVLRPEPVIFGVLRPTMSWRLRPRPDFTASRVSQYFMWRPEPLIFGVLRLAGPLNPTPQEGTCMI